MDELNTVNDVPELNVEAQAPVEELGESAASEQPQEVAGPAPPQSPEENAAFAKIRREAERAARETANSELSKSIAAFGYTNPHRDNKAITTLTDLEEMHADFAIANEAEQRGISFEEQQQFVESIKKEIKESDPEFVGLRRQLDKVRANEARLHMSADFDKILKHNPKETAKSITELGNDFFVLMAAQENRGETPDPIRAYEMVRAANSLKSPPPSMGDIKQTEQNHTTNRYASMSDADFEKAVIAAERGELRKGN